jgi:rubrerythrin
MRDIRHGSCPLCSWNEILESVPADFSEDGSVEFRQAITYARGDVVTQYRSVRKPIGTLLRYTCRRCGYCQTFAEQPDSIPVGEAYKTRLIKGDTPQR